jgi:hypothetical protein
VLGRVNRIADDVSRGSGRHAHTRLADARPHFSLQRFPLFQRLFIFFQEKNVKEQKMRKKNNKRQLPYTSHLTQEARWRSGAGVFCAQNNPVNIKRARVTADNFMR